MCFCLINLCAGSIIESWDGFGFLWQRTTLPGKKKGWENEQWLFEALIFALVPQILFQFSSLGEKKV